MGLFTNSNQYDIPTNESYDSVVEGVHDIMMEACMDDMDFFKALIQNDVQEVNAVKEGADVEAVLEGTLGDIWDKVKAFIKKVWAKVKALFEAFIARVTGFVTKDGKAYSKKYFNVAMKNIADGRCKNIKYKIRKEKAGGSMPPVDKIKDAIDDVKTNMAASDKVDASIFGKLMSDSASHPDSEDIKIAILKAMGVESVDVDSMKKDLIDRFFEDEEQEEGIDASAITSAKMVLEGNSKEIKDLKHNKSAIDSAFKEALRKADDLQKTADAKLKDRTGSNSSDKEKQVAATQYSSSTRTANAYRTYVNNFQEVSTTMIGASSEIINIKFKQARKVMALAASSAARRIKESVEDDDALDFFMDEEASYAIEMA